MTNRDKHEASWGERLLPFLFIGLETCCIDMIFIACVQIRAFGTDNPLLPLWTPFVLIASFSALTGFLNTSSGQIPSPSFQQKFVSTLLLFPLTLLASLFAVWLSVYAAQISLFDVIWLSNMLHALTRFDTTTFQIAGVFALSFLLCRHGSMLANQRIQPRYVLNVLYFGLCSLLLLVLIGAVVAMIKGSFDDEQTVILLIVLFLGLALPAHAIARIVSVRCRYSKLRVKGVATQERMTLQLVAGLSIAFLGLALLSGYVLNIVIPGQPQAIAPPTSPRFCASNCVSSSSPVVVTPIATPASASFKVPAWLSAFLRLPPVFQIVFILFVVMAGAALFIWLWQYWRRRKRSKRQREEIRENIWSWSLFLAQLRQVLFARFARLTHLINRWRWAIVKGKQRTLGESSEALRIHTVREIYRLLLMRAARHGYPRQSYETPYEFFLRLMQYQPQIEQQLRCITETYTSTRYGAVFPDKDEMVQIRSSWQELEKLWM